MRLVINRSHISKRRRAARLMVAFGLVILIGSFFLTFALPRIGLLAYIPIIIGFLLFNQGLTSTTKWSRSPRPDELLDANLRRLNDRYTLIHYPNMPGLRPEHVLVFPGGLVVITTREMYGGVKVEGNKWRKTSRNFLSFFNFGGPQLGNPTTECQRQQDALRAFLETRGLPGEDLIEGIIVFVHPKVELQVISSDLTVVRTSELYDAVRDLGTEAPLATKQREEIIAALSEGEGVEGPTPIPSRDQRPPKRARVRG